MLVSFPDGILLTPSPLEMFHIILALLGKAKRIDTFVKAVNNAIDFFHTLDPEQQATFMYLFSLLVAPVAFLFQDVVSTAPEPVCPFLGLQGMPFDVYPVEQGINEVVCLAASSCGVMTLTIGGLVIIFFMDLLYHPWILQDPVVPVNSNSSAVLLALISCSAVDKLRKVTLRVLAKSLSEEEFLDLSELFKTLDRGNSGSITAADLQQSIKWVGSKLADHEVQTLLDAADVHPTARIEFGEFLTARFSANNLEAERRVVTTEEVSPMGGASVKTLSVFLIFA